MSKGNITRYTHNNNNKKEKDKKLIAVRATEKTMDPLLINLLSHATPYKTESVLYKYLPQGYTQDKMGNIIYFRGKAREHGTMFSCHMDTVHSKQFRVIPHLTEEGFCWGFTEDLKNCILGADDKVGMYVMLRMLNKGIPGTYVFHVGEECGAHGSRFIASENTGITKGIKRCIAFDRKDYTSVITKQRGSKCASDEFARALSLELNKNMPKHSLYEPDPTGVFTDSASYDKLIPECTNLSVGYFDAHTASEHFDYYWLQNIFLPAVFKVNWKDLPSVRDPNEVPAYQTYGRGYGYSNRPDYVSGQGYGYNNRQNPTKETSENTKTGGSTVINLPTKQKIEEYNRVSFSTPWAKLPKYDMEKERIVSGVAESPMRALIYHAINDFSNIYSLARFTYDILVENMMLKRHAKQLGDIIDKEVLSSAMLKEERDTLSKELENIKKQPLSATIEQLQAQLALKDTDLKTYMRLYTEMVMESEKAKLNNVPTIN